MTDVYLQSVQIAIRDRNPRTAHQLELCTATRLLEKPTIFRTAYINYESLPAQPQTDDVMYTAGQHYSGSAGCQIKWLGNGGPKEVYKIRHVMQPQDKYERLSLSLMRGVRWCFFCGHDLLGGLRHSRGKTTLAIEVLKSNNRTALLTAENLSAIYAMTDVDAGKEVGSSSQWVRQVEDGHIDDKNIALLLSEEGEDIEQILASAASFNRRKLHLDEVVSAQVDGERVKGTYYMSFEALRIDARAIRRFAISMRQYYACRQTLNIAPRHTAI